MPATVSQVATGLATRLATISGLRTSAYQPEQLNPPFAFPTLNSINYHRAMGGGDVVMDWTINVVVGRYVDRNSFTILDGFFLILVRQVFVQRLKATRRLVAFAKLWCYHRVRT